jgi:hypothetical protein
MSFNSLSFVKERFLQAILIMAYIFVSIFKNFEIKPNFTVPERLV